VIDSASPSLENNTIADNTGGDEGGGMHINQDSDVTVVNTIFWDNAGTDGAEIWIGRQNRGSTLTISYSNVEGGTTYVEVCDDCTLTLGSGNIGNNPLFTTVQGHEYYLGNNSPCIDVGDPTISDECRPPGRGDSDSDMGGYGGANNCDW